MNPSLHRSVVAGARALALSISLALMACSSSVTGSAPAVGHARQAQFPGNQVVWLNGTTSGVANACLGPFTVQLQDGTGTPINAQSPGEAINVTTNSGSGQFFIDSGCQTAGFPAAIPTGSSTVDVYYKDIISAWLTVTDTGSGNSATWSVTIGTQATVGNQLAFINPQVSGAPGSCLGPLTVQLLDDTGAPINAGTGGEPISFSSDSPTGGQMFTDSLCQNPGPPPAIPAGNGTVDVYYIDNVTATITVTDNGSSNTAQQTVNIGGPDAGTPDAGTKGPDAGTTGTGNQVVWSSLSPISAHAGDCTPLTVQLEDPGGNPTTASSNEDFTANTSTPSSGAFFLDATCSNASANNFTILAGDGSLNIYYKDTRSGAPWLTLTNASANVSTLDVTIQNGPATHLVASGYPNPIAAGVTKPLTVTAYDFYNNVAVDYAGTVNVFSGDTAATNPPPHTFNPSVDFGHFDFDFAFVSTGVFTLTAQDSGNNWTATFPGIQVVQASAGNAVGFRVAGFPSPRQAGGTGTVTVTPIDSAGNPAVGYTGTINFSYNGPNGSFGNPTSYTFTADGPQPFMVVFTTAGTFDITVTDANDSSLTGSQTGIQIFPGPPSRFAFSCTGTTVTAGDHTPCTISALDQWDNLATNFTGTINVTSSDPKGSVTSTAQFPSGTGMVTVDMVFETAGLQMLTATNPQTFHSDNSGSINVLPAAYDHLEVSELPTSGTAGIGVTFRVSEVDAFGNVTPTVGDTIHFQSSDSLAQLPPDAPLPDMPSATQVLGVTFFTAGTQTLAAKDLSTGKTSVPAQIDVTSGTPEVLVVSHFPSPTVAGASHTFELEVQDAWGNRVTDYAGTIDFTSTDPQAVLPAPFVFTGAEGGDRIFNATLKTAGLQAITATEEITVIPGLRLRSGTSAMAVPTQTPTTQTNGTGITGAQQGIQVDPAAAATMTVSDFPSVTNAGDTQPVGVRLFDAFGNPASGYRGTVVFSSTDPLATLPPPYTFNAQDNGSHPFTAILRKAGVQSISAHDVAVPALAATESNITVVQVPPVIVHDAIATAGLNLPYPFNARGHITTAGGLPTSYASCGGPPEFQVDPASGAVSWTPTATGPVNLCVSATNDAGSDQYSFSVQVSQATGAGPVARISATPGSGPGPLDVTLDGSGSTADASTSIVAYRWRFGDGAAPKVGASVSHRYQIEGGYQALLEVVDGFGRIAIAAQPIEVSLGTSKKPPTARIVASAYSGDGSLTVNFSCDCQPGDGALKAWHWDTGEGTLEGDTQSVTFSPGVHNVHLTVTDANGLTATDSATITVTSGGQTPPSCHLYATDPAGPAPLDVTLEADVRPGSAAISQRQITLFDGSTTSEIVVAKALPDAGRYTATLSVTDANGQTCSDSVEVNALASGNIVAPKIVSAAQAAGLACAGYEYDALASGSHPLSWKLVSDSGSPPAGLTVDAQTGVLKLSAAPAFAGPIDATLVVENSAGQDSQTVHLDPGACQLTANVGCEASPGDLAGLLWLAPTLIWFRRRRRADKQ